MLPAQRIAAFSLLAAALLAGTCAGQIPELPPVGGSSDPKPPLPPAGGGDPPGPPLPPLTAPTRGGDPARLQPPTTLVPGGTDLELVEKVIEARKVYANSLKALHEHYQQAGDTKRMQMAEDELRQFHRMPHPVYRLEMDVPSPKLQPLYNQREANELYRWAMSYKDKGLGNDFLDNQRRAEILLQELLSKYPQSTKISDAAYMLGDIYEGRAFRQYERAAAYYERCFQWSPTTPYDARLRAGKLYDKELRNRARAIELYRMVLDYETIPSRRQEAQRRLGELGAR